MIKNNWKAKALSLLAAIILWSFVITNTNPMRSIQFREVPVTILNESELNERGYAIEQNDVNPTVNVKVQAQRSQLNSITPDDLAANAEIKNFDEGIQTIRVKITSPSGVVIDEISPKEINVKLEKIINMQKNVELNISNNLRDDVIIEDTTITPEKVVVTGPRSKVNKIKKLIININDISLVSEGTSNLEINPVDENGDIVEGVSLSQGFANVSLRVLTTKEVSIQLQTTGDVADGYTTSSTSLSNDKVVVKGSQDALNNLETIKTEPVDISNMKKSTEGKATLELPEGVSLNDSKENITYKIEIQKK
ncbi:MAG: CdaR family protein [Tissierellia bacterium]|nr:CdaR family protein [Tissierellia bacterium]